MMNGIEFAYKERTIMATKSSKPAAAAKKTAVKKPVKAVKPKINTLAKAAGKAPVAVRKKRTVKATPSKATISVPLDPKPVVVEPVIPHEEISLRAYYIGERRQKMGWPGNPGTDWADAVKQLRAEALEKPLKKR